MSNVKSLTIISPGLVMTDVDHLGIVLCTLVEYLGIPYNVYGKNTEESVLWELYSNVFLNGEDMTIINYAGMKKFIEAFLVKEYSCNASSVAEVLLQKNIQLISSFNGRCAASKLLPQDSIDSLSSEQKDLLEFTDWSLISCVDIVMKLAKERGFEVDHEKLIEIKRLSSESLLVNEFPPQLLEEAYDRAIKHVNTPIGESDIMATSVEGSLQKPQEVLHV
jgi:hypothetical protein